MTYKKFGNKYMVSIAKGEEIIDKLKELCTREDIKAGSINGIGAAEIIKLGYFKPKTKEFHEKLLEESHEITSLTGNISTKDGEVYIHCHISVAGDNFQCIGGHLNSAMVSGACEVVIDMIDGEVERGFNNEIGLNILKLV